MLLVDIEEYRSKLEKYFYVKETEEGEWLVGPHPTTVITNIDNAKLAGILDRLRLTQQTSTVFFLPKGEPLLGKLIEVVSKTKQVRLEVENTKLIETEEGEIITHFSVLNLPEVIAVYPEFTTFHGPHTIKNGRRTIVLVNTNLKKGTKERRKGMSFPKLLMEVYLKKKLTRDLTVDHIDGDYTNDSFSNLQVLDWYIHGTLDARRIKIIDTECVYCEKTFTPSRYQAKRTNNDAGPFCSRRCTGLYGTDIQKGFDILPNNKIEIVEYKLGKLKK